MDSLRRWTDRNSKNIKNNDQKHKRKGVFQIKRAKETPFPRACFFFCDKQGHKSSQFESVKRVEDGRLILSKKKLCFNCTGIKDRAPDWRSNKLCLIWKWQRHNSICDRNENVLLTKNTNTCTYPLVIINIEENKYRALIDTGPEASYVSSAIISLINQKTNKKPTRTESNRTEAHPWKICRYIQCK